MITSMCFGANCTVGSLVYFVLPIYTSLVVIDIYDLLESSH